MNGNKPSLDRLNELLSYNPHTGEFIRKIPAGGEPAGAVAGSVCKVNGYLRIRIDGVLYKGHHLAIYMHTGSWPLMITDHLNRNRSDNRIENLRLCTQADNCKNNGTGPNRSSRSGYKGVSWLSTKHKWRATIYHNKRQIHLGYFDDPSIAHEVYLSAKKTFHPVPSIGNCLVPGNALVPLP